MADIRSGDGHGLLEFLDWAANKHEIPKATAQNLRGAAAKVLDVEQDLSSVDIRTIDVDDVLRRFEIKSGSAYNVASLTSYKSRFRAAVAMYMAWLSGEPGWRGNQRKTRTNGGDSRRARSESAKKTPAPRSSPSVTSTGPAEAASPSVSKIVQYTMPLRPDLLVHLSLPVDLTYADAERVANFVKSLAFDQHTGSPSEDPTGG